jgi:crotonobetainyl-CoA:carnitine CoA-transferase CaiB-like acyl-CoA transferase
LGAEGDTVTDRSAGLALSDVTVLDLSTYAVGPFATQVMAALGATVLKIERAPAGDPERTGEEAMFLAVNRGKHSLVADLRIRPTWTSSSPWSPGQPCL